MSPEVSNLINRDGHVCRNLETVEVDQGLHLLRCLDCQEDVLREVPRPHLMTHIPLIYQRKSIFSLDEEIPPVRFFALFRLIEDLRQEYFSTDAVYPGLFVTLDESLQPFILLINDGHIQAYIWDPSTETWVFRKEIQHES